ncbi:trypsin-like peptidase domain-containing protein [Snuella lapsa]|uniref:Do family serine endopeptidase n=1 Tax=Snuella lapsa TaxID=870481 RepID=A0ABP6Y6E2_9FLAO
MKKILSLVVVSALGGIITLGAYKLFIAPENKPIVISNNTPATFLPVSSNTLNTGVQGLDFTVAAEKAVHAVVHVKNLTISSGEMTLQDLFYGRRPQRAQLGTGSGVIVTPDGYIVTNNHVIDNSQELSVTLNNNKTYDAKVIGSDPKTDIAVIKIETDEDLPVITFGDSDQAKIGEWVLAVGNPFNLTSTVTAGIISAKSRDLSGQREQYFLQTDAAVNPGNSGGALVNTKGDLIGINTAITSQTGSYIGYSFAVPSNIAKKVFMDIIEYGNVQKGILGVSILNKNTEEAEKLGVNDIEGVYVSEVTPNSGADKAGIKSGDIIKKLDNLEISKFEDLSGYIKTKRPNDVVKVEVLRGNQTKSVPVTISSIEILSVRFMDMELQDLSDSFKKAYDIDYGVRVKNSENKWLLSNLGITEGYIITGINDRKIESIQDIAELKNKYGDDILDNIKRLEYINKRNQRKEVIFR